MDKAEAFRSGSLRGEVGLKAAKDPEHWGLARTVRETVIADQILERQGKYPAPKFRKARLRADHDFIEKWVRGCKFPWLNPR
jgi:hypothetical protein